MDRHTEAAVTPANTNGAYELDLTVGGHCFSAPDEPGVNYRGWTELTTIEIDGLVFDARDFPAGFVKALEKKLEER